MIRGEMILVGAESLEEGGADFFTPLLRGTLADLGIRLTAKSAVEDDEEEVAERLKVGLKRSRVIALIGRMGSGERDLTRKVLAKVTKRRLVLAGPSESTEGQHLVPFGAVLIANPHGKNSGLLMEVDGRWIMAFPGLMEAESILLRTLPLLAEQSGLIAGSGVLLRTCGLDLESVRDRVKGAASPPGGSLTLFPALVGVDLELFTANREDRLAAESALRERLGESLYGACGEILEGVVAQLLKASGKRLALAESCTGGKIGERLTRVPGSSDYFDRALVTYSNRSKEELLRIDPHLFARHGAVSQEVAAAMAEGVRTLSRADIGLSVTGIAGPGGGSEEKPVGLVCIALSRSSGTESWRHQFHGDREAVRAQAAQMALNHLRLSLTGVS
ncbi:MAG TPA: nicotinamide-nucleotide amidohydrolase family protein [Nitrospiria bacterium]|nr:nicotinamide-nucleotide amidohydrolase family protein [Nitrospiria bacterium]